MITTYFDINPNNGTPSLYVYGATDGSSVQEFMVYPTGHQGSNGNRLLTTSYIVDMGLNRTPSVDAKPRGPSRDRKGRSIKWDE